MGYSPRGRKESDTTEQLQFHFHFLHCWKQISVKATKTIPTIIEKEDEIDDISQLIIFFNNHIY